MNVAIVLLAAGNSSRMGEPKQLLAFAGSTLLRHAAMTALQAGEVVVVLGANASIITAQIADLPLQIVVNQDWEKGMGSSIGAGIARLSHLESRSGVPFNGCIIMLADQPHVTAAQLRMLIDEHRAGGKSIVASDYGSGPGGVPAFFARHYFESLASLPPTGGGKMLILKHADDVATIPMPTAAVDIDTPEDYRKLRAAEGS